MVATVKYWRKLAPGCGNSSGDWALWPKGPEPTEEDLNWARALPDGPCGPFSSWAPGKPGSTRAQQVGVDSARGREPGDSGSAGRSEGQGPPGRRAAPGTRPGDARRAPAPASGEVLRTPARSPGGGFPEGSSGDRVDIAFYVEDYFQPFSKGKKVFTGVAFAHCEEAFLLMLLSVCTTSFQVIIKSLQTL